jgi:archaellum biogenesis ATPase FlaH
VKDGSNKTGIILYVSGEKSTGKTKFIEDFLKPLLKNQSFKFVVRSAENVTMAGIKQATFDNDIVIIDNFEIKEFNT